MYNNKYSVTWIISNTIQEDFSTWEKEVFAESVKDFNEYFANASKYSTRNKKYISDISYIHNKIRIKFETEYPLLNIGRRGNALRQYSRILSENGMDYYVHEHRLMRTSWKNDELYLDRLLVWI